MEEWVYRALKRWPNVPALFGWLRLDRRGRWLIQGEPITRWQIVETINRNYAGDDRGRWYFQNGPQRGYMQLDYAPFVLRVAGGERLSTHTGLNVATPTNVFMDEQGALLIATEHGAGLLSDDELDWALHRMRRHNVPLTDEDVARALALPSGANTEIEFWITGRAFSVRRLDAERAPDVLGFVRDPKP
jgi:hypothetical protein